MYREQQNTSRPAAVEVHGLSSDCSLAELRQLCGQVAGSAAVLQVLAALEDGPQGLALVIYSNSRAADTAAELLDGYPLGNSYLHVRRADSLPNSLINLLFSLDQVGRRRGSPARGRPAPVVCCPDAPGAGAGGGGAGDEVWLGGAGTDGDARNAPAPADHPPCQPLLHARLLGNTTLRCAAACLAATRGPRAPRPLCSRSRRRRRRRARRRMRRRRPPPRRPFCGSSSSR